MNARQKAKYYKRKYEELANCPIIPQVYTHSHHIDTLKFERFFPDELIRNEHFEEIVVKDLANYIAEDLEKYVVYKTYFEPYLNKVKVTGEIRVVRL